MYTYLLLKSLSRMLLILETFPEGKTAVPIARETARALAGVLETYATLSERLAPVEYNFVYHVKSPVLFYFRSDLMTTSLHTEAMELLQLATSVYAPLEGARGPAYINCRYSGRRTILNEAAVAEVMQRHGITIYGPEERTLSGQIDLWQMHDLVNATLGVFGGTKFAVASWASNIQR